MGTDSHGQNLRLKPGRGIQRVVCDPMSPAGCVVPNYETAHYIVCTDLPTLDFVLSLLGVVIIDYDTDNEPEGQRSKHIISKIFNNIKCPTCPNWTETTHAHPQVTVTQLASLKSI